MLTVWWQSTSPSRKKPKTLWPLISRRGSSWPLPTNLAGDIAFAIDHINKQERLDYLAYYDDLTGLTKLPVDTLKIDRSFVIDMTAGPEGLALVSTIISLAHALDLKVVAEGSKPRSNRACCVCSIVTKYRTICSADRCPERNSRYDPSRRRSALEGDGSLCWRAVNGSYF